MQSLGSRMQVSSSFSCALEYFHIQLLHCSQTGGISQAASVTGAVRESLLYVSPMARITIHADIQLFNMATCSFNAA